MLIISSRLQELTTLFDLIYLGNSEQAEIILEQIPTLTQMTDSHGYNALQIAIAYGRQDIVKLLLDTYKMSLHHRNNEGNSPLLTAAYVGNLKSVKDILRRCPNSIRDKDRAGYNIFLKASAYSHIELLSYLAENYPDKFNKEKDKALISASYARSGKNSIPFLLNNNIYNAEVLNKALETARESNNIDTERLLQDKIQELELNQSRSTALAIGM